MGRVADAQKRIAENLRRVPESQPVRVTRPEAADLSDEPFPEEFPGAAAGPVSQAPIAEPERPRPVPVEAARLTPVTRPAWSEPTTRQRSRDASRGAATPGDARSMFDSIDEALRQEPPFRRRP